MPQWKPPKNMERALEEGDGMWEDESWLPIRLTTMSDTEYEGREIPIAWQIEFDPSEVEFDAANTKLEELGIEPDGYGWGEFLQNQCEQLNPDLAARMHTSDCETDNCVIWVESAEDCREVLETAWQQIHCTL
jgi:hypothetical protein